MTMKKNGQSMNSCQYFQDNLPHGGVQRDHGGVQPAAAAAVQLGPLHRLGGQVGLLLPSHYHNIITTSGEASSSP